MIPLERARLCLTCETVFDDPRPPLAAVSREATPCACPLSVYRISVALKSWLSPALDTMLAREGGVSDAAHVA